MSINIEQFIKDTAKTPEQAEALRINLGYKHSPAIRAAFGSLGAYMECIEKPEESPYRIFSDNGQTKVTRNTRRRISPITEQELIAAWGNNPQLRCEFPSIDIYRHYVNAQVTGRCKIISKAA
jgi:hypothetical protein